MNRAQVRMMVAGLGSPNGDDQAGWRVIDLLTTQIAEVCQLRQAKVPHELIDWIGDIDELHVVDACLADDDQSNVSKYQLASDDHEVWLRRTVADRGTTTGGAVGDKRDRAKLTRLRSNSSHLIDFASVMQLARQLNKLPSSVTVWTVPGRDFGPSGSVQPDCQIKIAECAEAIAGEISNSLSRSAF